MIAKGNDEHRPCGRLPRGTNCYVQDPISCKIPHACNRGSEPGVGLQRDGQVCSQDPCGPIWLLSHCHLHNHSNALICISAIFLRGACYKVLRAIT